MHEAMKSKSGARIFHLPNLFAASSPPRSPLAFSRISQLKVRWLACRSFTRSTNQTDFSLNVRSPELSGPEANLASPLPPDLQVWLGAESDRPQYATHSPITQSPKGSPQFPPAKKAYEYEWKAFFRTKHDTPRPLEPSRTLRTLLTVVAHSARSRDERVPELLLTTSPLTQLFVSLISTRFRPFPPFFSSSSSSALHLYLISTLSKYHHHHLCSLLAIRGSLFYSQKAAFTFKIIVVCLTDVASAPAQQSRIRRQLHTSNPDFA